MDIFKGFKQLPKVRPNSRPLMREQREHFARAHNYEQRLLLAQAFPTTYLATRLCFAFTFILVRLGDQPTCV
eukprot:scaffold2986_cov406-Prasinococcus_capsulatus_cf.AAC.15